MSDIIDRLEKWMNAPDCPLPSEVRAVMAESAAEIERLRTAIRECTDQIAEPVMRLRAYAAQEYEEERK